MVVMFEMHRQILYISEVAIQEVEQVRCRFDEVDDLLQVLTDGFAGEGAKTLACNCSL